MARSSLVVNNPTPVTRRSRWHVSAWKRSEYLAAALFIAPGLIWFLGFMLYPLVYSGWMSLHEWKIRGPSEFVGLANYARVFADNVNLIALRNTVVYALLSVPAQMLLGLLIALGLEQVTRGKVVLRLIYYLPVICSWVVVSLMFMFLFNSEGLFNHVFGDILGLVDPNTSWLNRASTALPSSHCSGCGRGWGGACSSTSRRCRASLPS